MRTWKIATSLMACGKCIGWIEKGQPVQLVYLSAVKQPKVRCQTCADGPVPDGLMPVEAMVEFQVQPSAITRLEVRPLPFDARAAALGREGE